ncbi:GNAT family N-acetyltransferase [Lysobacter gummosus]|uniref:GNAT family N-acetyltransferase n=1 Tax=Lysobacter gummosus TaxID=262324 RepID=UPI0036293AC0
MIDFDSEYWFRALRDGLGAQVVPISSEGGGLLACFRAGPFRVAYPDFLIGVERMDEAVLSAQIEGARQLNADMLRIQADRATQDVRVLAQHALGSIAIPALAEWTERNWEKARRSANRQARSALRIRSGRREDGVHLYRLYLSTLHRHSGAARYTQAYFEAIAPHAALVAELEGSICGFVCVGYRGARACYMHGAHLPEARAHYPSDQLFLAMLRSARDAGLASFDFLPSPASQDSLSAYKRAWGGCDTPLVVSDLALRPVRARAFSLALKLSRSMGSVGRR